MQSTSRVMLGISALIFVGMLLVLPKWTVDDAYISYRYGKNWVETGEMTWNPGEKPFVEGYTGILLPVISALSIKSGLDPVATGRWMGVLGFLLAIFSLWRIGIRVYKSEWAASIAVFWLVSLPFLYTHALSGLETMVFVGLLTFTMLQVINLLQKPGIGTALSLGVSLLLCGFTRPEGILLAVSLGITLVYLRKKRPAGVAIRLIAISIATYLIPAVAYFVWRLNYYEALFPNTFYAKAYEGWINVDALWAWARFGLKFIVLPASIFVVPIVWTKWKGNRWQKLDENPTSSFIQITSMVFCVIYFMFYLKVNLYMNYEYRFWVPVLPFAILVFMPLVYVFKDLINNKLLYISSTIALIYVGVLGLKVRDEFIFTRYYHGLMEEEWKPVANWLKSNYPEGTRVAVMMDVGAIGYYSECEILDLGRLNNPYLAQSNISSQEARDYLFSWNPQIMVFTSFSDSTYQYIPEAMEIQADPRFLKYELLRKFGNSVDFPYFQYLYSKATNEHGLQNTAMLSDGTERN